MTTEQAIQYVAMIDPPCPEMAWLRKLNKWIREGGQG